jgi:hypothetical protein
MNGYVQAQNVTMRWESRNRGNVRMLQGIGLKGSDEGREMRTGISGRKDRMGK